MVESVHGRLPGIKAHIICPRLYMLLGLPGVSDGKESACNAGDPDSIPGSEKIPWRREWLPSPVLLPQESHALMLKTLKIS